MAENKQLEEILNLVRDLSNRLGTIESDISDIKVDVNILKADVHSLKTNMTKVLKCVSHENADFDPIAKKHKAHA